MPKFSLIVATKGRAEELEFFLASLVQQNDLDNYELIIVDQNPDDRLKPILGNYPQILCKHLRCGPGVSKARNLGLSASTGEFIAFPDDDCWYPPDTLRNVERWFADHLDYGILSVTVRDETGIKTANKWNAESCDLAPINIFRTSATYTFFLRRSSWDNQVYFDENIGPASGTPFGCGEDTDFVLSLMARGVKGRFTSIWHVGHPRRDMLSGHITYERALGYGRGMGRVLRKHSLPLLSIALFSFDMFRVAKCSLKGQNIAARLCRAHGKGILEGYFARPTETAAIRVS